MYKAVEFAIYKHGLARDNYGNVIFAYETDCYGNSYRMDDANIPSLLSLPYLDFVDQDDQIYQNTRRFVLSDDNPFFYQGNAGEGIGGPHAGNNQIWPMSIIIRAMTTDDEDEIITCLKTLVSTTAGTNFMHETFNKDFPDNFTRGWFAWANSLFGELIAYLYREKPHILEKMYGIE